MAIGSSLGGHYETQFELEDYLHNKKSNDAAEIAANETSGDFQSRFYATDQSTMPPGASTELAGALKQKGGTQTPEKVPETNFLDRLSIFNAVRGMGKGAETSVKEFPENFKKGLQGLVDMVKTPGEAMQGKLPMWAVDAEGNVNTSPMAIEKATDLAALAITGPAPVASKLADGTLGSFAGVKSQALNKNQLAHAQILEANGIHPDDVFTTTGFFRGADSRWRYEIPDRPGTLNQDWHVKPEWSKTQTMEAKLPEVLDHPELYKAYPELKNVTVIHDPNLKAHAQWEEEGNIIRLSTNALADKASFMHEIQHAIQGIEGFAKGGSPASTSEGVYKLKYQSPTEELLPRYTELANKYADFIEGGAALPRRELIELAHLNRIMEKYKEYVQSANIEARAYYERLGGEVEARNVGTRSELPPKFARNVPPIQTEDIARSRQINLNDPAWASPYGIIDPKTGKFIR